jgi:hypothetical protein
MSGFQEYHYTAYPTQALCLGHSCYCFQGHNQMNEPIYEVETPEADTVSEWSILPDDSEWTVSLRTLKFRHPRTLLAYIDFVFSHNELATSEDEKIVIPQMPTEVSLFILNHSSLKEPPPEFKDQINRLRYFVELCSRQEVS